MKKLIAEGRLEIHTNTVIKTRTYETEKETWMIKTEPATRLPDVDYVYFATGVSTDYKKIPYLQTMLEKYPVDGVNGLPCLTDDMAWTGDVPLYVAGRLASLRLGPGAPNLVGARVGAERIAWSIQDYLVIEGEGETDEADRRYRQGVGSRYDSLVESSGDEKDD